MRVVVEILGSDSPAEKKTDGKDYVFSSITRVGIYSHYGRMYNIIFYMCFLLYWHTMDALVFFVMILTDTSAMRSRVSFLEVIFVNGVWYDI